MKLDERLRRRRCLGLRVAAILGVILAVINRADTVLLVAALAGIGVVLVVYWRDCRGNRR
jgi:drug/metabolite transporter (DMT)-like permease